MPIFLKQIQKFDPTSTYFNTPLSYTVFKKALTKQKICFGNKKQIMVIPFCSADGLKWQPQNIQKFSLSVIRAGRNN
jgi:hypothetical protein